MAGVVQLKAIVNIAESAGSEINGCDNRKSGPETVVTKEEERGAKTDKKLDGGPEKCNKKRKIRFGESGSTNCSLWDKPLDLDDVFVNELGQFGRFQLINFLLISILLILNTSIYEFIFSAAAVPHRCRISECGEENKTVEFRSEWIQNAIPLLSKGDNVESCLRFQPIGGNGSLDYCPANLFNRNHTIACDSFVYESYYNSVVSEFDLGCQEWLRALSGFLNSLGTLIVLPIIGYVSDRFGRRIALVISIFNVALFGFIRAFSVNYTMYLALQLIQTTLGSGLFSSAYVFSTELVGPKWRVFASASCCALYAVGEIVVASVAWLVQPWRYMILALHIPCFFMVSSYWFLPESVRWLLSKKRYTEARDILEKVAIVNKKQISESSLYALTNPPSPPDAYDCKQREEVKPTILKAVVQSPILFRRVCTTPIWWIATTFIYYGLCFNSTALSGNMYFNFILISAIEIPGYYTSIFTIDRIGRKPTLSCGFLFSAGCNITFAFISPDMVTLRLCLYLMGKFCISLVFTALYLFTSELYPTEYRHTLLAFSSMIGRIGSITAPLTVVLIEYWTGLPSMLFGSLGLVAGLLVLTQPETKGLPLPDTLLQAEAIGRKDLT